MVVLPHTRVFALSVLGWVGVALVLHAAVLVDGHVGAADRSLVPADASLAAAPWVQFDSFDYLAISDDGYGGSEAAHQRAVWFPGYPASIRVLGAVVHPASASAVLAAALAGLAAVSCFGQWMLRTGVREAVPLGLAVLLLYPYAWFLAGGAYSTPQFLAAAVAAFWALEARRVGLAALLGALATVTHPMGLALCAGLLAREAELAGALVPVADRRWRPVRLDRARIRDVRPVILAPVLGLVAYSGVLWATAGRPLLWLTERSRHRTGTLRDASKVDFFVRIATWTDPQRILTTVVQFGFVVAVVLLIPAVGRRFGWGYALYVSALIAMIVFGTADFNGSGRYLLAAFPVAALVAERLLRQRAIAAVYLTASGLLLVTFTVLFSRSWYLT